MPEAASHHDQHDRDSSAGDGPGAGTASRGNDVATGWILGSVSRVVAVGRNGNPGRMRGRPCARGGQLAGAGSWSLGRGLGAEPLEVRALLSGRTVSLIKDVNAVETNPVNLTPAGSNLFYTVEDSTDTGANLMVTNAARDPGSAGYRLAGLEGLVR